MREFAFELRLCAHLERRGGVVARQLGASVRDAARVMDVVRVEPGPAFDERVVLSPATIPPAFLESDAVVGEWRAVTDVVDGPPERARRVVERAAEAGYAETARRNGRDVVRRAARYPDWVGGLVGVENKPDLGRPGDLATQLRKDVSLGLFDAVVVATESHVTGAHRNRLPDEVGIWRVDFDRDDPIAVVREPTPLGPDEAGLQVVERRPGRTAVRPVEAAEKARQRRRVAERAYGKGWRTYRMPPCARAAAWTEAGTADLPGCPWKGRLVDAERDCGPDCAGHDPADPPATDLDGERARRTPWDPDPAGRTREQAGLEDF